MTVDIHVRQDCTPDRVVNAPGSWTGNSCQGSGCSQRPSQDAIYQVTIPSPGDWTFSLCGSSFDTYLCVGTSCCGSQSGCNDDFCGRGSELTTYLTAGTYYVAIEAYSSTACGNYVLTISGPPPPDCCPTPVTTYPACEGLESGFGDWVNVGGDDFDWTWGSGSTPSTGTGPSAAVEGLHYVYTEATGHNNETAILQGPCFDFTSVCTPMLEFWFHMYGSDMGSLRVEVSDDSCVTWTEMEALSGNQGNMWIPGYVNLSPYSGSSRVVIRFVGTTGSGYRSDMAVDDICVVSIPCDDGLYCSGEETCVSGDCLPGSPPCSLEECCDEVDDVCGVGRPADFDRDCSVDLNDYDQFYDCFGGPGMAPEPTPPITVQDCLDAFDRDTPNDNDVDLKAFAAFQSDFTGPD